MSQYKHEEKRREEKRRTMDDEERWMCGCFHFGRIRSFHLVISLYQLLSVSVSVGH